MTHPLIAALQLAGALQALVLAGYVVLTVRPPGRVLLPGAFFLVIAGYFAAAAGLGSPIASPAAATPAALSAPTWLTASALLLPALWLAGTYLMVAFVLGDGQVAARHWLILLVPAPLVPLAIAAAGVPQLCLGSSAGPCVPTGHLLAFARVPAEGVILLLMVVALHRPLAAVADEIHGRAKRHLILALYGLAVLVLAVTAIQAFPLLDGWTALVLDTAARLGFVYLITTTVLRVFPEVFTVADGTPQDAVAARADASPSPATGTAPTPHTAADTEPATNPARTLSDSEQKLLGRIQHLLDREKVYQEAGYSRRAMANELGVPEHQLSKVVNVGLGEGFSEAINRRRIDEAKTLLADTDSSVSEIAFEVGFNSLPSFNRTFKQLVGRAPSRWRAEARARRAAAEADPGASLDAQPS